MRTLIYYIVYLLFSFGFMVMFFIDILPPLSERIMATIMLWCFIWALSVTQVVGVGKLLRRQKAKEIANGSKAGK